MSEHEASQVVPAPSARVFEVVQDLRRLPEWLPTVTRAESTDDGEAHLEGTAGGGSYESEGFWRPSPEQLRVEWSTPSRGGEPASYSGWLQVHDRDGEACEVTVHLSFFEGAQPPPDVDDGLRDSLQRLAGQVG